jgi:hypothetical protein
MKFEMRVIMDLEILGCFSNVPFKKTDLGLESDRRY